MSYFNIGPLAAPVTRTYSFLKELLTRPLSFSRSFAEYLATFLLSLTSISLIALQIKPLGWFVLAAGVIALSLTSPDFRRNIALIYCALAILGITPINTSTDFPHSLQMGGALFAAVFIPYVFTKYIYKNHLVRFPLRARRKWYKSEITYILVTATIAYVLLPLMLRSGDSYLNWHIEPGLWNLIEAYIGLNVVGIWDELFFVSTVLGILRGFLDFRIANVVQAVIFTSFLYTLGFQGWCFVVIFAFALIQGYIFKRTDSLLYILTIHLTVDLVLHVALVYLHHPGWMPIFIT